MDIIITIGDALPLRYIATLQIIKCVLRKLELTPSYTKDEANHQLSILHLPEAVKSKLLLEFK